MQLSRRRKRKRARRRPPRSALGAIASSALALPGLASADTPEGRWTGAYGFSMYREDKLPESKLASGSRNRYEIDSHQVKFEGPVSGRMELGVDFTYESMSGATVEEQRYDTLLHGNYYFDNARAGFGTGFSIENDYKAINLAFEGETGFWEKNATLSGGIGGSFDMIEPTDAEEFDRPENELKGKVSVFASYSQILGQSASFQTSLTYQHQNGYLSDPYKLVSTTLDGNLRDNRPSMRNQLSWLSRFRKHFRSTGSTLHLDYQFYIDDWELNSHTIELAWYQSIFDAFRIIPSMRYYSQSAARFYGPFFETLAPGQHASSDYRLSPYGAFSFRIQGETRLRGWPFGMDWRTAITWERYISDADFALGSVSVANPGLVSFSVLSVSLTGRF